MKIARVLVTDTPVPGKNTASWPKLVHQMLQDDICKIDAVISPPSTPVLNTHHQVFYCNQQPNKLLNKLKIQQRYRYYFAAIQSLLESYDALILCVIDSSRVKNEIYDYLKRSGLTNKVSIMFYFHGYSYFFAKPVWEKLADGIRHFVFLTRVAYEYHLAHNVALPFAVSVLHNPVDKNRFKPASIAEKKELREKLGWENDCFHFVWLSHNRPKKGFDIILNAWVQWNRTANQKVKLHVIGVNGDNKLSDVDFIGVVDNDQVPDYLRAADIGLFSSLVLEGFPLSLMEMISCGCFMIASQVGGVREFFKEGVHGIALYNPNEINAWILAFQQALIQFNTWSITPDGDCFLDFHKWALQFDNIFRQVELSINISQTLRQP